VRRRGARRTAVFVALGAAIALISGGGCSALESFNGLAGAPREAGASDGANATRDGAVGDAKIGDAANDALELGDAGGANDAESVDASDGGPSSLYRALVMSDGPIMYLRLNDPAGSTTAKDETGNYKPTLGGTVTFGTVGALAMDPDRAVTFDGLSSIIDVGATLDFNGTNPYTLEAWVNASVSDNEYRFVYSKNLYDAGIREEFGLVHQSGALAFERYVDNNGVYASGGLPTGAWKHLAAVYDGANTYLYVNGTQVAAAPDTRAQPPKSTHFTVGAQDEMPEGVFAGSLDEIAVYAKALTAGQLQKHYLVGTTGQ
jgi:hypothetical protein